MTTPQVVFNIKSLNFDKLFHFKKIINSQCSVRNAAVVDTTLYL